MYRLAPSRCARRPKQPANRSRNLPSRSSTARAVDSDKSMPHQHTKLLQKSTVRIIGSLVRKIGSDKVLLSLLATLAWYWWTPELGWVAAATGLAVGSGLSVVPQWLGDINAKWATRNMKAREAFKCISCVD